MSDIWTRLAGILAQKGTAALVTVLDVAGSAPREAGARMIVAADGAFSGTIGGGQLEWEAFQLASGRLRADNVGLCVTQFALGPDLGQCCGGRAVIAIELFTSDDRAEIETFAGLESSGGFACEVTFAHSGRHGVRRLQERAATSKSVVATLDISQRRYLEIFADDRQPVLLFGAGHVGRAVVLALAPLPFRVTWIDSRSDAFPKAMPGNVQAVRTQRPAGQFDDAPAGAFALIMTHSHALDLEICRAALDRTNLAYVGLIGSETKRARFMKRLADSGLAPDVLSRLRCPIGVDGIDDKSPAVIAASVAVELLLMRQAIAKRPVEKERGDMQAMTEQKI